MLYDISILVSEDTPPWPGDAAFSCSWTQLIAGGASVNLSTTSGSPHVGTHADAPLHVCDGWNASEELPVAPFIGRATVVDVSDLSGEISKDQLSERLHGKDFERVLLRTRRTVADGAFPDAWPWLSQDALYHLLGACNMRLLGVDAPSVDPRDSRNLSNHVLIFTTGCYILENLDLRSIDPGVYELVALPLRVAGLDAAPVRAFLRPATQAARS
jgi:arylformamidase